VIEVIGRSVAYRHRELSLKLAEDHLLPRLYGDRRHNKCSSVLRIEMCQEANGT